MAGLRWRAPTALTLLAVFAFCVSLQQARVLSAKDKSNSGNSASNADEGVVPATAAVDAAAGNSSTTDAKSAVSKSKTSAEKKKASKKKGKPAPDNSADPSGVMPSGNSTGSGVPTTGFGGQSTGSAGAASGTTSGKSTISTPNSSSVAAPARKPAAVGKSTASKAAGGKANARQSTLDFKNPIVKKVVAVQNRNHDSLVSQMGIYGSGTGLDDDGNVVIRVYTTGADSPQIPKTIENVPVVEVMTGPIHPCQGAATGGQRQRVKHPVPIGVSIYFANSCNGTAVGTLGCRLKDQNGNLYILSSNHVLCNDAVMYPIGPAPFTAAYVAAYPTFVNAIFGNPSTTQPTILGTTPIAIVQPAPIDENCQLPQPVTDTIGSLFAFVPFNDQNVPPTPPPVTNINGTTTFFAPIIPPPANQVDAAIARVSATDVDTGTPPDGYGVPTPNLVVASLGLNVQKYGRTTAQTFGTVLAVNVRTNNPALTINLPFTGNPVAGVPKATAANAAITQTALVTFTNEVEIGPTAPSANFALPGDSGALVVDMSNNPVALVRAFAGTSIFCGDISEVIFELQQQLINIILTVDNSPSFRFSSRDGKLGRGTPGQP